MPPASTSVKFSKFIRLGIAIAVIAIIAGAYVLLHLGEETTDDAAIEAHVVTLAPKVGGYIKTLYVNDNDSVKAGQVLAEIDPTDYIIRRIRAKAALEVVQGEHGASAQTLATTRISAPSAIESARAQLAAAKANWTKASNDLNRMYRLNDEARSREQLDNAVAMEETALSSFKDATARLHSAEASPKIIASAILNAEALDAQVKQAAADLTQAEKDLYDTKIIAPMDGRITQKGVEVGDYVQPGQQLGFLVSNEVWVVANFKETQLVHMHPGNNVKIAIDAFPGVKLEGKIDSIQAGTGGRFSAFPPENATGNFVKVVQRVPVKILLNAQPDTALHIGPGMSIIPTVYTK